MKNILFITTLLAACSFAAPVSASEDFSPMAPELASSVSDAPGVSLEFTGPDFILHSVELPRAAASPGEVLARPSLFPETVDCSDCHAHHTAALNYHERHRHLMAYHVHRLNSAYHASTSSASHFQRSGLILSRADT